MDEVESWRAHLARLLKLAAPVTAAQLGAMLLMVVDLVMLGRVGVFELDAAALGRVWMLGTAVFGMGLLLGIDPVATQAFGRGDRQRLGASLGAGLVLALAVGAVVGVSWLGCAPALRAMGQDPALAAAAGRYLLPQIPGLPFFFGFFVVKQYLQAQGIVYPAMWVTFAANLLNVLLNWVLIFGRLGAPALGVVGAGIATTLTHVFLFVALVGWMTRGGRLGMRWRVIGALGARRGRVRELVIFGLPVAVQLGLEMWTFQIATLLAGRLGHVELGAHTAVLTLASVTFMMPLGISLAAVIRVGNLVGERALGEARRAAWAAVGLGAAVMGVAALVFVSARWQLPRLFSPEPAVIAAGAAILPIAAAFQVFDGIQVVGSGVLRGMGQTRPAAAFNVVGYYMLALPLAWLLSERLGLGLAGIWWGLCAGLGTVAGLLLLYLRFYGPGVARS